jgi:thioredoxin-related protein
MRVILIILMILSGNICLAQSETLYKPESNAKTDIRKAIKKAKRENKHVLIQAGGNWCKWCLEFARFAKADKSIDSLMEKSFVRYHLNYSKEQKNEDIFKKYRHPNRFGFPVFIILDQKGKLLHIQNSEYLEDGGKSYDNRKVFSFLKMWTPEAIEPAK